VIGREGEGGRRGRGAGGANESKRSDALERDWGAPGRRKKLEKGTIKKIMTNKGEATIIKIFKQWANEKRERKDEKKEMGKF